MAQIKAYGNVFRDWEALLGACQQNVEQLPGLDALRTQLTGLLEQARALKIEQENLIGTRKAATQRLQQLLGDGKDTARKLRAFVQGHLGSKNEQLSQFGIAPTGVRSRKAGKRVSPPKQTDGAAPGKEVSA